MHSSGRRGGGGPNLDLPFFLLVSYALVTDFVRYLTTSAGVSFCTLSSLLSGCFVALPLSFPGYLNFTK